MPKDIMHLLEENLKYFKNQILTLKAPISERVTMLSIIIWKNKQNKQIGKVKTIKANSFSS